MKTIIVAAGQGIRLRNQTDRIPKTLLPFRDGTILSHVIANFVSIGVSEFVIVVGYWPEMIIDYVETNDYFGQRVTFVENREWKRGNGLSVAAAASTLGENESAFLTMSDHLVPVRALEKLADAPGRGNLLLTDPAVEEIFDIDDATKVQVEDDFIVTIGKELSEYNAVDCGIFRVTPAFFRAIDRQAGLGKDGISDGVRHLIHTDGFKSVTIPEGCRWIDIDTPESYKHALSRQEWFGSEKAMNSSGSPVP